jgi:hypothetical protein
MTARTQVPIQQSPYLRVQRNFPSKDPQALEVELDRSYTDIASKMNERVIGTFALGFPIVTGERWFLAGANQKQQTLRQLYTFTSAGNIAHNINLAEISGFSRIYGTFTDGTNWYPLPYVDVVAANNQVGLKVTPTNIVVTSGSGSPPSITSGYVVLEWLSLV